MALFTVALALTGAARASGQQAQQILDAAGVKGGLIVHLGCGDGKLTAALRANNRSLVHGLDADPKNVEASRAHIRSLGLYGQVSVDHWRGNRLPYVDNLVSLLVSSVESQIPSGEIMRVLAPGGVALALNPKSQIPNPKSVKPRPAGIDDWPHFLHDATNNAVAHDALVGPPQHVQWMAGPAHGRHHEHTSSISVVVSAGGRLFYVHDEGPTASMFLAAKWVLVARDAFNGVCLWKRPIAVWHPWLAGMGANPPWLPRTLVAIGDHLYAVLGLGQPISDLDAATGQTLRVFEATKAAEEILAADGRLYVVAAGTATPPAPPSKRVLALDPATGQTLWEKSDADTTAVRPLSLAVHGGRVFFLNRNVVLCLDAATGRERWRHALPVAKIPASLPATLVAYRDVVLCADRGPMSEGQMPIGELTALSAETGQRLWTRPCAEGWASPVDVFVADGLVWVGSARGRGWIVGADTKGEVDFTEGLDPLTGEVKRRLDTTAAFINRPHHHRCYRDKATDRFLLVGRHGVEFIPLQSGEPLLHDWIRGMCRYGVLPCNGLLYLPSHPCQCHVNMMLTGFCALASGRGFTVQGSGFKVDDERLDRGTAYAVEIQNPKSKIQNPEDWPTYRGDASRSGSTKAAVPTDLRPLWQADLGGKPTGVVVAEGRALVANADTHEVLCLDVNSGKMQWRYTAGGRVDSPPTIHEGRALFGSADGWVYCLRLSDGALVWRFRAAPDDLRTVVNDQLESVWPVHGSVLVKDGAAYFAAGRSSNLDGGIHVYRLDVRTGRILSQTCLNSRLPGAGKQQGLPDLMAADNEFAYMRFQRFPLNDVAAKPAAGQPPAEAVRLVCPTGFLDDTWWHRGHWVFAPGNAVGNIMVAGTRSPAGHIMVFDDDAVYGYGRKPNYFMWTTAIEYRLFAADRRPKVIPLPLEVEQPKHPWLKHPERQFATRWSCEVPIHVRAMALSGQTLFIAGPPSVAKDGPPESFVKQSRLTPSQAQQALDAWEGRSGAVLWAVSASDGAKLAEYRLDSPPVWDGMAVACGRLYLSTTDGKLACFGGKD